MMRPQKAERPAGTGRQGRRESNGPAILPQRPPAAQVERLRLAARCLDLAPVFVCDAPLTADLFDGRGVFAERWSW